MIKPDHEIRIGALLSRRPESLAGGRAVFAYAAAFAVALMVNGCQPVTTADDTTGGPALHPEAISI